MPNDRYFIGDYIMKPNRLSENERKIIHEEILRWEKEFHIQEVTEEELEKMAIEQLRG